LLFLLDAISAEDALRGFSGGLTVRILKQHQVLTLIAVVAVSAALVGCGGKSVSRISTDSVTDLSGYWNDTDSRLVADEMIEDCLTGPWKQNYRVKGVKPSVIVGSMRNKSSEHIAVGTFIGDIERAYVNSGEVNVVASAEEREQVRDEREDQQQFSSEESAKRWGREQGADFMLTGVINTIADREKGESVMFYQVDMTLIDLETNSKSWIGQKKIKKYIGRGKYKP
jgi:uncharacterized protein (TIGR02722 family)